MSNKQRWSPLMAHYVRAVFYIGIVAWVLGSLVMWFLFLKDPTLMRGIKLLACYAVASYVGWIGGSAAAKAK